MSSIWLTVEFSPGSDISDCCKEAVELAGRLKISVHGNFNGVLLMAAAGDNPEHLARAYHNELTRKTQHKIATAHRGANDRF